MLCTVMYNILEHPETHYKKRTFVCPSLFSSFLLRIIITFRQTNSVCAIYREVTEKVNEASLVWCFVLCVFMCIFSIVFRTLRGLICASGIEQVQSKDRAYIRMRLPYVALNTVSTLNARETDAD